MNNTKWHEIFRAFYENECDGVIRVPYRTKALSGYISDWDVLWEHFGCEFRDYKGFERLEIELTDENREFVIDTLKKIHVPGDIRGNIAEIYGYRQDCGYI